MAGTNPNDILMADLCVIQRPSRISRQYALKEPLSAAAAPTAIASLGCHTVVSAREAGGNVAVLGRFNQNSGTFLTTLLTSADGDNRGEPGPTSHLYAVPGDLLSGSAANPFPLSRGNFTAQHVFGSDIWFIEASGGFQLLNSAGHIFSGFGGSQSPYWVLNLPPGREFKGVGRFENHVYDNYVLMPVVSFPCEPMSLIWDPANSWYAWTTTTKTATIVTNQVADEQWTIEIQWREVRPALLSAVGPTLSATLAGDAIQNGAGLFRSYAYKPLESDVVMPDFGDTLFRSYSIAQGDLRPPLVVYTVSTNEPSSWSLDFESLSPTTSAAALPTPQRNPFDTGAGPQFFNYDTCHRYAIPTKTARDLGLGDGERVYLEFDLSITGGFSQTGFIEFVKDSLVSQAAWNATPRYFELTLEFTLATGLP